MTINYKIKTIKEFKVGDIIEAQIISYEISEEDMISLSEKQTMSYEPLRVGVTQDYILYDLLSDNIEGGFILEGGLTPEGKFLLNQYIVTKGLNEFLKMKQLGGSNE